MRHLFRATRIGWGKVQDGVWFDSASYSKEEAAAQFIPFQGETINGYPYTGYEYDGVKYHHFDYLGEFEDDSMPTNDEEFYESLYYRNHPELAE